jgi:hypothetical protein
MATLTAVFNDPRKAYVLIDFSLKPKFQNPYLLYGGPSRARSGKPYRSFSHLTHRPISSSSASPTLLGQTGKMLEK